jgi:hypothetical protein
VETNNVVDILLQQHYHTSNDGSIDEFQSQMARSLLEKVVLHLIGIMISFLSVVISLSFEVKFTTFVHNDFNSH